MDSRLYMVAEGWYLEYEGRWYRVNDYTPNVSQNSVRVTANSAETDLDNFLTNYGQVPFSLPSHTPTEIMDAVFSGTPECLWFNGDFSQLDSTGFAIGWDQTAGAWTVYGPDGENTVLTTSITALLTSEGIRHTSGAEIKPIVDVYVGPTFIGVIQVILSWRNSAGVESSHQILDVTNLADDDWVTFEASDWMPIRNERCHMTISVENNAGAVVAFRRARFVQNEPDTEWQYLGSMDVRAPEVVYNDSLFRRFGTWILDPIHGTCSTTWAGDTLMRPFTGDQVTVVFAAGGTGAKATIMVDGLVRVTDLDIATARQYQVSGLNRHRSHTLEVVAKAGTVAVTGLVLSTENRVAVTWNRLGVYQALKALKDLVGGEYLFDTRNLTVFHDLQQGEHLTNLNLLWLREGVNLESFVLTVDKQQIQNRCYMGAYGDGALQIGVVVDADVVDEEGYTSQERFGTRRFSHTNKEVGDFAAAAVEALGKANEKAFAQKSYTSTMPDEVASLIVPGDTVRVTHSVLGGTRDLRAIEVSRSSDGSVATVIWGDRLTTVDPAAQYGALKRRVDQLLRAY